MRWLVLTAVAATVLATAAPAQAIPAGPRLATVELRYAEWPPRLDGDETHRVTLRTVGVDGGGGQRLLGGVPRFRSRKVFPQTFHAPSWSPDGKLLAFTGTGGGKERIYLVRANGKGLRPVPGTIGGRGPVFSPDGRSIAFSRSKIRLPKVEPPSPANGWKLPSGSGRYYASTTTWTVGVGGGRPRRLTPWGNGVEYEPTSFSPAGRHLLLARDAHTADAAVVRIRRRGGRPQVLARRAEGGVYSPDGRRIAFVSYRDRDAVRLTEGQVVAGDLYSMLPDGSGLRRLTRTRGVDETSPSWSPSGRRIGFLRHVIDEDLFTGLGSLFPVGNSLTQVNADGTCARTVYEANGAAFYGAAWQPGPGREAGRINC